MPVPDKYIDFTRKEEGSSWVGGTEESKYGIRRQTWNLWAGRLPSVFQMHTLEQHKNLTESDFAKFIRETWKYWAMDDGPSPLMVHLYDFVWGSGSSAIKRIRTLLATRGIQMPQGENEFMLKLHDVTRKMDAGQRAQFTKDVKSDRLLYLKSLESTFGKDTVDSWQKRVHRLYDNFPETATAGGGSGGGGGGSSWDSGTPVVGGDAGSGTRTDTVQKYWWLLLLLLYFIFKRK